MTEKKDKIDSFFDTVDKWTEKYVDKMSQVSTPEKEDARDDRYQAEQHTAPRGLLPNPDLVIVDPDDSTIILKALTEASGAWKQRATADGLPERSRALHRANSVAAETIAEEIAAKLSQGFHIILKR